MGNQSAECGDWEIRTSESPTDRGLKREGPSSPSVAPIDKQFLLVDGEVTVLLVLVKDGLCTNPP
jgi:hypothetical protein